MLAQPLCGPLERITCTRSTRPHPLPGRFLVAPPASWHLCTSSWMLCLEQTISTCCILHIHDRRCQRMLLGFVFFTRLLFGPCGTHMKVAISLQRTYIVFMNFHINIYGFKWHAHEWCGVQRRTSLHRFVGCAYSGGRMSWPVNLCK